MKKLSDYQGEDAIELWADLLEPFSNIFIDRNIAELVQEGKPVAVLAAKILKTHKADAVRILERIDDTPINGINLVFRLMAILGEMSKAEGMSDFFGSSEPVKTENESTGSATENTEDGVK